MMIGDDDGGIICAGVHLVLCLFWHCAGESLGDRLPQTSGVTSQASFSECAARQGLEVLEVVAVRMKAMVCLVIHATVMLRPKAAALVCMKRIQEGEEEKEEGRKKKRGGGRKTRKETVRPPRLGRGAAPRGAPCGRQSRRVWRLRHGDFAEPQGALRGLAERTGDFF